MTRVSPTFRHFFNLLARAAVERPWLMAALAILKLVPFAPSLGASDEEPTFPPLAGRAERGGNATGGWLFRIHAAEWMIAIWYGEELTQ